MGGAVCWRGLVIGGAIAVARVGSGLNGSAYAVYRTEFSMMKRKIKHTHTHTHFEA